MAPGDVWLPAAQLQETVWQRGAYTRVDFEARRNPARLAPALAILGCPGQPRPSTAAAQSRWFSTGGTAPAEDGNRPVLQTSENDALVWPPVVHKASFVPDARGHAGTAGQKGIERRGDGERVAAPRLRRRGDGERVAAVRKDSDTAMGAGSWALSEGGRVDEAGAKPRLGNTRRDSDSREHSKARGRRSDGGEVGMGVAGAQAARGRGSTARRDFRDQTFSARVRGEERAGSNAGRVRVRGDENQRQASRGVGPERSLSSSERNWRPKGVPWVTKKNYNDRGNPSRGRGGGEYSRGRERVKDGLPWWAPGDEAEGGERRRGMKAYGSQLQTDDWSTDQGSVQGSPSRSSPGKGSVRGAERDVEGRQGLENWDRNRSWGPGQGRVRHERGGSAAGGRSSRRGTLRMHVDQHARVAGSGRGTVPWGAWGGEGGGRRGEGEGGGPAQDLGYQDIESDLVRLDNSRAKRRRPGGGGGRGGGGGGRGRRPGSSPWVKR
jgi:hypothetical protein